MSEIRDNSSWDCYVTMKKWLQNRNDGKIIGEHLSRYPYKKVAIYGAGDLGQLLLYELRDSGIDVLYFIDKTAEGRKSEQGIPIILFKEFADQDAVDAIIVTPMTDYESINHVLIENDIMVPTLSLRDMIYEM